MAAALSIAVLMTLSFAIVRIAAVALRLTGLAENVARFQCISALTGTGFTTSESELIVNYPIRRRILVALMILGNLGLVSIAAALITSLVSKNEDPGAILHQVALIAAAVAFVAIILTNKTLDRALCGVIGVVLHRATSLAKRRFHRLCEIGDGTSVAEHRYRGPDGTGIETLRLLDFGLVLMAIHGEDGKQVGPMPAHRMLAAGDTIICFGSDQAHEDFEDLLTSAQT